MPRSMYPTLPAEGALVRTQRCSREKANRNFVAGLTYSGIGKQRISTAHVRFWHKADKLGWVL